MKPLSLAMGAALACMLTPGLVRAQQAFYAPRMQQPASVQPTAYQPNDYAYAYADGKAPSASPSDAASAPPATMPGADCESCGPVACDPCMACCDPGGAACGGRFCRGGALADPWTLFPEFESGLTIGDWLSTGVYGNAWGARDNGPLGFREVGNGFTSDQNWLYIEKPVDTSEKTFDWGFRMDYMFGADGPDTQAFGNSPFGWDNGWISSDDGVYGSAIPQLYGEIGIGKLSVKMGHFYTLIGYEVVPAPDNFFYSHAYCMFFAEPFTHTGVLGTYALTDDVSVHAGWTTAWDTGFENPSGAALFLGGVSTPVGEKITFTWICSGGDNGVLNGADQGDLYMNSFVVDVALSDNLNYVFQHDLGLITNAPGANAQWYGINQYLLYQLNDCWALGGRLEWFRDDDAARVLGTPADYWAITGGLNFKPHANFTIRPELRYDWANGPYAAGARPFNDGADREQLSGGVDLIFTF